MDITAIQELLMRDAGCAQIVAGEFTEETGLDRETLYRMAAAFDGGMMRGETCGAVVGAYMVIGLIAGHSGPDQMEQKGKLLTLEFRFNELFLEKRKSFVCKELIDADISTPEGMDRIINGGIMMNECPCIIMDVVSSLKQAIEDTRAIVEE